MKYSKLRLILLLTLMVDVTYLHASIKKEDFKDSRLIENCLIRLQTASPERAKNALLQAQLKEQKKTNAILEKLAAEVSQLKSNTCGIQLHKAQKKKVWFPDHYPNGSR